MSQRYRSRYCRYCGRKTMALIENPAHIVHAGLTVLSCGLWFPIYLLLMMIGTWKCSRCGSKV